MNFERLHETEKRHAEWRMLDAALAERRMPAASRGQPLRVTLGHVLIRFGAWLTGERVVVCTEPNKSQCS